MKMLLNGKKVGTEGREEIIVINPYTHEEIDSVPCADLNDIDTALECAREGAEKSACAGTGQDPGESFF